MTIPQAGEQLSFSIDCIQFTLGMVQNHRRRKEPVDNNFIECNFEKVQTMVKYLCLLSG